VTDEDPAAQLVGQLDDSLGIRKTEGNRDLDGHILPCSKSQYRLLRVQIARGRDHDQVHGRIGQSNLHLAAESIKLPLPGEDSSASFGARNNPARMDASSLGESLHVVRGYSASPDQTDIDHRSALLQTISPTL
jgi:hypothetical protein